MTSRENFLHFFKGEPYDWTPTNLDLLMFRPSMIRDHIARALVLQQEPYTGEYGGKDSFGINWIYVPSVGGSMEDPDEPHLFEDIEDWEETVRFPDIDAWDWEGCAKANTEFLNTDKLIHTTIYTGFFERLISFTGFENAAMDLIDEDCQESIHALFTKLADLYIEMIKRLHRYFNVEMVEIHDDWGNQRSLMFSADIHREMVMPYMKRIAEAAHAEGVFIEQHSCGKIEDLVPNIIESGVDTWRGQDIVDKKMLVDKYGDRFHFGTVLHASEPITEEQAMEKLNQLREDYHGKDVWLTIYGPYATPAIKQMVYDEIRKTGKL